MPGFSIPDELTEFAAERRLIPFIGAGFSGSHSLPTWDELLKSLAEDLVPDFDYNELSAQCGNDYLQIAEYLYLKAGASIGPIRHRIALALQSSADTLRSSCHVELANLGAAYIYTTNYDELIEQTYSALKRQLDVLAVPRDVALAKPSRTQLVKFHGDVRYDETLVLTESQYYARLDLESPMDLKLRADLLGRSALFVGYSFSDINIRVIWFKLMQMMRDVPVEERPASYIVRLTPNAVLEELYNAVGIRTVVLDPDKNAISPESRTKLLSRFMHELANSASPEGRIPGTQDRMFASDWLLDEIQAEIEDGAKRRYVTARTPARLYDLLTRLAERALLPVLSPKVAALLDGLGGRLAPSSRWLLLPPAVQLAVRYLARFDATPGVTALLTQALLRQHTRRLVLQSDISWLEVWNASLDKSSAQSVLAVLRDEIEAHEDEPLDDDDIAYAADLAARMKSGQLQTEWEDGPAEAAELLERAAEVYPVIEDYEPVGEGQPHPSEILNALAERRREAEEGLDDEDDAAEPWD